MFAIFEFIVIVFLTLLAFVDTVAVEHEHFEMSVVNCKDRGGLKTLFASSYFGKESYTAMCVDGTNVQEKTK